MTAICGILHHDGPPPAADTLERMARAAGCGAAGGVALFREGRFGLAAAGDEAALAVGPTAAAAADGRLDEVSWEAAGDDGGPLPAAATARRVLAAADRWADGWHERLEGGFAAAVWDRRDRVLELARDRVGERALYWAATPRALCFASEPVQLLAAGGVAPAVDGARLLAHLLGARAEAGRSYFRGVHRLPEGHRLVCRDGRVTVERWWSWRRLETAEPIEPAAATDELLARLGRAVASRLARRGETGVLLSGGLDSGSVAVEAAAALSRQGRGLNAFTWTSEIGDGIDETGRSRALLARCPGAVEQPVAADDLWPLSRWPAAYSDPNAPDASTYPDLLLATLERARRQGVEVLLNGLGGDLVVGGVVPELALLGEGDLAGLARRLRSGGLRRTTTGYRLRAATRRLPRWLGPQGRRLAREGGFDRAPYPWAVTVSRHESRLFAVTQPAVAATLERLDRLSRRHGVRLAAPWHDPELVDLALALPDRALAPGPPAKRLLREAMRGRLPPELLAPATAARGSRLRVRGLLELGRPQVEERLAGGRLSDIGMIDGERALRTYRELADRGIVMPGLWPILTAEGWLRTSPAADGWGSSAPAEGTNQR